MQGREIKCVTLPLSLSVSGREGGDEELRDMDSSHPFPVRAGHSCTGAGKAEPGLEERRLPGGDLCGPWRWPFGRV